MDHHSWYEEHHRPSSGPPPSQAGDRMYYAPAAETEYAFTEPNPSVPNGYCAGCHLLIRDRHYLSAVDRDWHVACLVCSVCRIPLDSHGTCYTKDGQIYCKQDYYSRYGWKHCARCSMSIAATELVMRVKELVYHINCFACAECNERFSPGEQYALVGASVYCRAHYQQLVASTSGPPTRSQGGSSPDCSSLSLQQSLNLDAKAHHYSSSSLKEDRRVPVTSNTLYEAVTMATIGSGGNKSGRASRKRKSPPMESGTSSDMLDSYCGQPTPSSHGDAMCISEGGTDIIFRRPTRQKRMRTSFKHHELRIMKSYFSLNHNPDAKDLKQLSIKTGLSKRVLQVWFQNARAKFRRNSQKESNNNNNSSSSNCSSISSSRMLTVDPQTRDRSPGVPSTLMLTSPNASVTNPKNVVMTTADDITRLSPSLLDLNSQGGYCQVAQTSRTLCGASELSKMGFIRGTFNSIS